GAAEPRFAWLGKRLEPSDHLLRLKLVEFECGFADQRGIPVRFGQPAVGRDGLVSGDRELRIVLLKRECGAREQRRSLNRLAAALGQVVELLRRLRAAAAAEVLENGCELLDLFAGPLNLVLVPPDQSAASGEEQHHAGNQPIAVLFKKIVQLVAPEVLIDLANKRLTNIRGLRQSASVARSGIQLPQLPFPTRDERKLAPDRLAAVARNAKGPRSSDPADVIWLLPAR